MCHSIYLNLAMYSRIFAKFDAGEPLSGADAVFYQHELIESRLMNMGLDARDAHLETLMIQGIDYAPGYEAFIYDASIINQFPEYFSPAARAAAGVNP